MGTYRNIGGTWRSGNWWRNILGSWKQCAAWRNINGVWKNLSVVFDPDGGSVEISDTYVAQYTLTCSQPATWVYSTTSSGGTGARGTVSIPSGSTASGITFRIEATAGSPGNRQFNTQTWSVTGMSGGVTRSFSVTLTAEGDSNL